MPAEILERSNELGDEALAMLEDGSSTAEVEAWLSEQPEMAEVAADDLAVRFRLEGGRAYWVLTRDVLKASSARVAASAPSPATDPAPPRQLAFVVGGDRKQKKALVLSPFLWQFGPNDAGIPVAAILSGTRGYENGVTYLANQSKTASAIGVDSFTGWQGYQVIYVDSHGYRLCDPPPCRAMIVARAVSKSESKAAELGKLTDQGVGVGLSASGKSLVLDADFFRFQYPGGLDDTVVFFNACETHGSEATDLADAIRGKTSVFLGWDEPVDASHSAAAGVAFYQELSKGYTVELAHSKLGGLRTDPKGSQLRVGTRARGDLRIRDVVSLRNPDSGRVLSTSDEVAIVGELGDGEPDAAPYLVQVDGMPTDSASGVLVHVSVDGVEGKPRSVSSGEPRGQGRWWIRGVFPLGSDLEEEKRVTFRAWVELPSGGQSDHEARPTLTGLGMGLVWQGEAKSVWFAGWRETTIAQVTFEREPDRDPAPKHVAYVLTEATITWAIGAGKYFEICEFSASAKKPRRWRIPPEKVDFSVGIPGYGGRPISNGHLVFDLTKSPVEYAALFRWQARLEVTLSTCYGSPAADPTRPFHLDRSVLVVRPGDHRTTLDRKTISGKYKIGTVVQSQSWEWTLKRVK